MTTTLVVLGSTIGLALTGEALAKLINKREEKINVKIHAKGSVSKDSVKQNNLSTIQN